MYGYVATKINAHFKKIHSLSTGGAHSRVLGIYTASPTSPPYVGKKKQKKTHSSVPHTATVETSCLLKQLCGKKL